MPASGGQEVAEGRPRVGPDVVVSMRGVTTSARNGDRQFSNRESVVREEYRARNSAYRASVRGTELAWPGDAGAGTEGRTFSPREESIGEEKRSLWRLAENCTSSVHYRRRNPAYYAQRTQNRVVERLWARGAKALDVNVQHTLHAGEYCVSRYSRNVRRSEQEKPQEFFPSILHIRGETRCV